MSAYNTDESTDDIEDIRIALHIDSLNLLGISYNGGLLMNVLRKYPSHILLLILDSLPPEFVNIDEQELAIFNHVLDTLFARCERDSAANPRYHQVRERFHTYFAALGKRAFRFDYKGMSLYYGRNELLEIIHGAAEDFYGIKTLPYFVSEMIEERPGPYLNTYFVGVFDSPGRASGMRFSVYCSDKMRLCRSGHHCRAGKDHSLPGWLSRQ